jgi:general secretion pathway protein D
VVTGTIEYKDIGIILTVTPRISDAGLITIELQIEDSTADTTQIGSQSNLLTVPLFKKKTAKTTLSVIEGQMIVIGGLIGDSKTLKKSGIPFLSKIPILGGLFGRQEYVNSKTETILLMTPHIITDQTRSRAVTDEFQQKLKQLRKDIEEREKEKK